MSTIQNDSEKIQIRSRKPDQGSDQTLDDIMKVSLRDAVVENLMKKVQEQQIGLKVQKMWLQHKAHVEDHNERMQKLQMWDEFIDDIDLAYDGTSNIHIPMPMVVLKTFHARMFQALFAVDPPFSVRAMQEAFQDDVDMVYGLMSWTLSEWANFNEGVEATADRWLWKWAGWGNGCLKVRWERKFTRYVDVEDVYIQGPSIYQVTIDPDQGTIEEVESPQVIRSQRERPVTELVFEGPVIEYVSKEDLAIIGNSDVQRADAVIHREWMTSDQLQSLALQRVFDSDVVDEIIKGGPHAESARPGQQMKADREVSSGVQTLDIPEDLSRYEILEAHIEIDINNDGLNESLIVWVDGQSGKELRATYLHRVFRGGKRPFVNIEFLPREGHGYAMGLLELIFPLSVELDMIHNIKVDIGIMAAQPIGFYRAATGMDAVKLKIKPGDLIPVDDPSSHVFFPNLGDRSGFFKDEEAILLQHVERLTAINDINTSTLGRQGAARTATGVAQLVSENSANLDIFIKRMQRGWRQVLRLVWALLQQRLPDGLEFRATGKDGKQYFQQVNRMDIQQRVDFALEANSANSNRQIQLENTMQVLSQTMNPLFMQLGIVEPDNVYEALKDYFLALGRKDFARFIKKKNLQTARQFTAEEELRRVLAGQTVEIQPDMDHQGFIDLGQKIIDQEGADQLYGQNAMAAVQSQIQQHTAIMEAMKAQAAQIAQANQQTANKMGVAGGINSGQAPFLNMNNAAMAGAGNINSGVQQQGGLAPPGSGIQTGNQPGRQAQ
jgi:hypothetical protein